MVEAETGIVIPQRDFVDEQTTREMVTARTTESLLENRRYKMTMKFVSQLNDYKVGFYRSSYVIDGVRRYGLSFLQYNYRNDDPFPMLIGGWRQLSLKARTVGEPFRVSTSRI